VAARYLAERDAKLLITDLATPKTLGQSLSQLAGLANVEFRLGRHDAADFATEYLVVNPAVSPRNPYLQVARDAGTRLVSEIEMFLDVCPARVIGVTGSNGKSTTCAMLDAILTSSGRRSWLGGNIGRSLLGDVERMTADDWVVLELSSFQLAHLHPSALLPSIAVITNCTENHLDWHETFDDYGHAKQRLLAATRFDDVAVINPHDPCVAKWATQTNRHVAPDWPLDEVPSLTVPGEHNRQNAACAAAAAAVAGVDRADIRRALTRFQGLEHRHQFVGEIGGRRFYDDSKSTSPAATIAALSAIDGPVWLLAGGEPKGVCMGTLAAAIVERACGAAVFGAARDAIRSAVTVHSSRFNVCAVEHLRDAFACCLAQSRPGDAIVLSPACASHDQFADYRQRGAAFRELVRSVAL
jgi:UDP-N-acetylmuramoylalanine--D-glutamate ligase